MRVLFLTHRLPYAPNRGDRIRAYHMLKSISAYAEVDLVSLTHTPEEERQATSLDFTASIHTAAVPRAANLARGLLSLPTRRPLTHSLLNAPSLTGVLERLTAGRPPDVVLASCSGMARFALDPPLCYSRGAGHGGCGLREMGRTQPRDPLAAEPHLLERSRSAGAVRSACGCCGPCHPRRQRSRARDARADHGQPRAYRCSRRHRSGGIQAACWTRVRRHGGVHRGNGLPAQRGRRSVAGRRNLAASPVGAPQARRPARRIQSHVAGATTGPARPELS